MPFARVLFFLFAPVLALAQFSFSFDPAQNNWNLRNGHLAARFQFTEMGQFVLRELRDMRTGDVWLPPENSPSSLIRLQLGDAVWEADSSFRLLNHSARAIARRAYRYTIALEDVQGRARIFLELEMYEGQPFLRWRTRVANLTGATVWVRGADMLPLALADGGKTWRLLRVNQWVQSGKLGNFEPLTDNLDPSGTLLAIESGAYGQHCAWLALRDSKDRGLVAGWEFDGRASASVRHLGGEGRLALSAEVRDLNHPVPAGQQFISPWAFIGTFHGDWDEAGYRTQRFAEAALSRPLPEQKFPYLMWDSWKYQTAIDEHTLIINAQIAASLGVEVFVVDLGWARMIGDWHEDPRKFPSGLRALSDYVHSLGMKFGLHLPLAEAAANSPVLIANPDWTSTESYGYFEAKSLCLSHRPVREWIVGEITRMIDDYGVDWIVQDGENMVKRCVKTTHTHDPMDSNYSNAVDGLNAVVTAVQAQRPRVLWENCEDGGNMMTLNMVKNYVTSIAADDSGPLTTRQAVYGVTYPFSPRYADRYMPDEELGTYNTRSSMFGGPWILMNRLAQMRPQDLDFLSEQILIYKRIRARIRDGKVFHLTPRPAENRIDAIQSYHEATNSAIIFVTRPEAPAATYRLRPHGLRPGSEYMVRFQDDRHFNTLTGRQLMEFGVLVPLPSMWATEIVYIEPLPVQPE